MKNILILAVCMLVLKIQNAQVVISAIPPVNHYSFTDLWNISVSLNTADGRDTRLVLEVTVFDAENMPLMRGKTRPISVFQKKIVQITPATLDSYGPLDVVYLNPSFKTTVTGNGNIFPAREYRVEITCYLKGRNSLEPVQRYEYFLHDIAVSPLQLVSVYNNDTISVSDPLFTWIPPGPLPSGLVDYEIMISVINEGETRFSAINTAVPMVRSGSNGVCVFKYDAARPQLENGRSYAWKVNALLNGNVFATSEVWQFTYRLIEAGDYMPEQYYVMNERIPNNCVYVDSNVLPITFVEDYYVLDSLLNLKLYDSIGTVIGDSTTLQVYYTPGSNYCYVSFCPDDFPLSNGRYVLEVLCKNDKSYFIRFVNKSMSGVCAF